MSAIDPQQFAHQHCNKGELDCSWYHGSWHLLKALGVVSTSAVHELSINQLLDLALSGMSAPRILITGSTDETLVRLAHSACLKISVKETINAIDICATPLAFMQTYADEKGIELVTIQSNILEYDTDEKFDIILTHAFMGYFDDKQRPQLTKKWRQLLSDQGKIITIQRVRPVDSPSLVTFDPQQSSEFITTTVKAAQNTEQYNKDELERIKSAATDFAKKFTNYAITSKIALESLFTDADLTFQLLEYHHLEKKGELSGPSVPSNAEFAHIIAKKR